MALARPCDTTTPLPRVTFLLRVQNKPVGNKQRPQASSACLGVYSVPNYGSFHATGRKRYSVGARRDETGMSFHISEIRNAIYCGRQAYYEAKREACRVPSPETRVLRELAHLYPTFVESPDAALRRAEDTAGVSVSLDLSDAADALAEEREDCPKLWDAVARPDREERYLENGQLHGTADKLSFNDERAVVSLVKTGTPPANGVWSSERVEAAAVRELVSTNHDVSCVVVEYPRVGALRRVEVERDDERALERALETLEEIEKGVPPSRTDNRSKCESCNFKEECGVKTKSVLTRLRERFG